MPAEAVVQTLRHTLSVLDKLNLPAALMGGLSLAAWNRIRSTQDVDLLVVTAGVRIQSLLSSFGAAGFRAKGPQPLIRVDDAEFIQLLYEPRDSFIEVQVDLLLADTDFSKTAMARRVPFDMQQIGRIDVLTCEDLIIMKLMAGRMIDMVDVAELLYANQKQLDMQYLGTWISKLRLDQPYRLASEEATRLAARPI